MPWSQKTPACVYIERQAVTIVIPRSLIACGGDFHPIFPPLPVRTPDRSRFVPITGQLEMVLTIGVSPCCRISGSAWGGWDFVVIRGAPVYFKRASND
jgi:hypothetical protein